MTKAIRSKDADNEAWYLISPIGLKRLAKIYGYRHQETIRSDILLSRTINYIRHYFNGDRNLDYLAMSLYTLCEYIHIESTGKSSSTGLSSVDEYRYDLISPIALQRIAQRYRLGENKYGAYNCERGFPIHDLLNHALRHIYLHLGGLEDEPGDDNLGGVGWGLMMAMHSEEMWPELNRGHLRGPDCTITEDIEQRLQKFQEEKINERTS